MEQMTAMTFFGRGGEEKCLDTGENTVLLHVLGGLGDISLLLNLITPRAVCATTCPLLHSFLSSIPSLSYHHGVDSLWL